MKAPGQIFKLMLVAAIAVAATACSGKKGYTVEGKIEGLGTQNLTLYLYGPEGMSSKTVTAIDSEFSFEGTAADETVVEIFNSSRRFVGAFAVKNGDKLKLTYTNGNPLAMKAKGNPTSEALARFIDTYGASDTLDIAIERFVAENPESTAALLAFNLFYDPSADPVRADSVYSIFTQANFPPALGRGLKHILALTVDRPDSIAELTLPTRGDSLRHLSLAGKNPSLLYFDNVANEPDSVKNRFDDIDMRHTCVAHIRMLNDTFGWARSVKDYPEKVERLWALGGVANPEIAPLALPELPYIIVTDTLGHQIYRGVDLDSAKIHINLKKK